MELKPTYEMLALTQRVADGDITALPDLWPLMFTTPFDPTRPIEDIGNDIADRWSEYTAAEEDKKAKAKSEPTPAGVLADSLAPLVALVDAIVGAARPSKK